MKMPKGPKGTAIIIILVLLVLSYYYYLSNRTSNAKVEEDVNISAAQEVLLKDYTHGYPPTPKEVLKDYLEITKVLHNETLTDEQVEQLGVKIQSLYDVEFVANKSQENYLMDLKSEIATFRNNNYSITNYYTSASTDVEYYKMDGYDFAKLYATYSVRTDNGLKSSQNVFLMRKDSDGHWKIYGWMPVENAEGENK